MTDMYLLSSYAFLRNFYMQKCPGLLCIGLICFLSYFMNPKAYHIFCDQFEYIFMIKNIRYQYFSKYYQEFSNFYALKFVYVNKEIKI